jgi:hypothetical protein
LIHAAALAAALLHRPREAADPQPGMGRAPPRRSCRRPRAWRTQHSPRNVTGNNSLRSIPSPLTICQGRMAPRQRPKCVFDLIEASLCDGATDSPDVPGGDAVGPGPSNATVPGHPGWSRQANDKRGSRSSLPGKGDLRPTCGFWSGRQCPRSGHRKRMSRVIVNFPVSDLGHVESPSRSQCGGRRARRHRLAPRPALTADPG